MLQVTILIWISLLSVQVLCFTVSKNFRLLNSNSYNLHLVKSNLMNYNNIQFMCKSDLNNNRLKNEIIDNISQNNNSNEPIQGYLSSDLNALGDNKQTRVLLYIGLALLPCLFLVPFFMSRDFVPPIDPNAMIP